MAEQYQGNNGPDLAWVELTPADENALTWDRTFRVFQIDVKSDTDVGHALHDNPLSVLRENLPSDLGLDEEGVRAQVLRVNAERPANPVKRKEVWIVYPGNTTAVGVQYKYAEGE